MAGVEGFGFLGEVAEFDVVGDGDGAGRGGEFAADGAEERCLAAAIGALDGPALATAEGEGEVFEDGIGAVGEGEVLDVDGRVAGAGEVAEIEGRDGLIFPGFGDLGFVGETFAKEAGGAGDFGRFGVVESAADGAAGGHVGDFGGELVAALGGAFEGGELALFGFVGGPVFLVQGFRVAEIFGVGTGELAELAAADLEDAGGDLVEEIFVVRDEEAGVIVAQQLVGEPVAGAGVEVVGWFVEQEDAGGFVEDFGETGAGALAGGERGIDVGIGLGEVGEGEPARLGDDAGIGRLGAGDYAEKRGLPCPVGADEGNAIAGVDIEIDRLKKRVLLRIAEREATGLQV